MGKMDEVSSQGRKTSLHLITIAFLSLVDLQTDKQQKALNELLQVFERQETSPEILASLIANLTKQKQELIRRAVNLLENLAEQDKPPQQSQLLGAYIEKFLSQYSTHYPESSLNRQETEQLAWKLLLDLLFYSSNRESERLLTLLPHS